MCRPGRPGLPDVFRIDSQMQTTRMKADGKFRTFWSLVYATQPLRDHPWAGDVFGVLLFALALAVRFAADGVLPAGFPYVTFFPAVVLATFIGGLRAGIICATLSGLAAWYFFIQPAYTFSFNWAALVALAFYIFVVAVDIVLIQVMHRSVARVREEKAVTAALYDQQKVMFQELQHRVANNMQFVASLLNFQTRRIREDPSSALAALDEARLRLETISRIHRRLYDPESIDLPVGRYLQELCSDLMSASGAKNVVCLVDAPTVAFNLDRLTILSLLVAEIITNALKHAFVGRSRGTITLRIESRDIDDYVLTITDDGNGMPPAFDPLESKSLGLRIITGLAAQLNGKLTFSNDNGTIVRLDVTPWPKA